MRQTMLVVNREGFSLLQPHLPWIALVLPPSWWWRTSAVPVIVILAPIIIIVPASSVTTVVIPTSKAPSTSTSTSTTAATTTTSAACAWNLNTGGTTTEWSSIQFSDSIWCIQGFFKFNKGKAWGISGNPHIPHFTKLWEIVPQFIFVTISSKIPHIDFCLMCFGHNPCWSKEMLIFISACLKDINNNHENILFRHNASNQPGWCSCVGLAMCMRFPQNSTKAVCCCVQRLESQIIKF